MRAYVALLTVLVVALAVALEREQGHTGRIAKAACERAQKVAPELAVAYRKYKILSPAALTVYEGTIPPSC